MMSIFSESLTTLIKQSNCTLPQLAAQSKISVALLSKFKSGSRLPTEEETVKTLLLLLRATPTQSQEILKEYHIEKLGRNRYRCFNVVRDILESMKISHTDSSFLQNDSSYKFEFQPVHNGEERINSLVQYLINQEYTHSAPSIKMIISSEYLFLNKYITSSCNLHLDKQLDIYHVLSLLPVSDVNSEYENLCQLKNIIPLVNYCNGYSPYYVYTGDNSCQPYPYFILTTDYLLTLSADLKKGILYQDKNILDEYSQAFDNILSLASPFFEMISSAIDYLKVYGSPVNERGAVTHLLSTQPCMLPFVPPHVGLSHLVPELADNPFVLHYLSSYFEAPPQTAINLFTLEGLTTFLKNGRIIELPSDGYTPFTPEESREIVEGFSKAVFEKKEKTYLLKPNSIDLSPFITCYVYPNDEFAIIWQSPHRTFCSICLREQSTSNLFIDFIRYLTESREFTYSYEESLERLNTFMNSLN